MEIPPLAKIATTRMLVQWAGASCDFNPLHYEDDFAKANLVNANCPRCTQVCLAPPPHNYLGR